MTFLRHFPHNTELLLEKWEEINCIYDIFPITKLLLENVETINGIFYIFPITQNYCLKNGKK